MPGSHNFSMTNAEAINEWSKAPPAIVEQFGEEGDLARQYLLNPAIFALLGNAQGKTILDAGCGQGYLVRLLARKGAVVTGVEPARNFYTYALAREQSERLGITYLQADLSSLNSLHDTFDAVIANMVFMDIPDYQAAIRNCIVSLKKSGAFIFSLLHPCFEEPGPVWLKKGYVEVNEYFQERAIRQRYGYFFHRPLSAYLNLVIDEGCSIQRIIEPRLSEELAQYLGNNRDVHVPSFIVIYAVKQ